MNRVLIVGEGYAGSRFRRAFEFLDDTGRLPAELAVADPRRLAIDDRVRRYHDVETCQDSKNLCCFRGAVAR